MRGPVGAGQCRVCYLHDKVLLDREHPLATGQQHFKPAFSNRLGNRADLDARLLAQFTYRRRLEGFAFLKPTARRRPVFATSQCIVLVDELEQQHLLIGVDDQQSRRFTFTHSKNLPWGV
ncbi:hypothetical protein D9M71_701760 [compost metagenome]